MDSTTQLFVSLVPMISWGVLGILVAKISRKVGSFTSGFLIMLVALLMTLLIWPIFFYLPNNVEWWVFILLGILGGGTYAAYNRVMEKGKVPIVVPITSTWAVVAAFLGIVILGESFGPLKLLSIALVVIGIFLISYSPSKSAIKFTSEMLLALLVAVGWGFYFFFLGPLSREYGWFFTTLGARVFVVITLLAILLSKYRNKRNIIPKLSDIPWKILVVAGVLDVIAFTSFNMLVSELEVSFVSVISSASPLITVSLAAIVLKEKTTRIQKVAVTLMVGGIITLQISGLL